jgi:Domain of unknown function (DUF4062)
MLTLDGVNNSRMAKIYVSSTYADLKDYRETVYRTLRQMGHGVIAMEDYVATDQRPVVKCLADVAGCDLYPGLFAWRYGYVPPAEHGNLGQKSIIGWSTPRPSRPASRADCSCSKTARRGPRSGRTAPPGRTRPAGELTRCAASSGASRWSGSSTARRNWAGR